MASSFDKQNSESSAPVLLPQGSFPRLFNVDLPLHQLTGRPLPEQTEVSAVHRLLDIASGRGEWALSVARLEPELQVVGIERDVQQVEYARREAQAHGLSNVSFINSDPFGSLDLPEASFDLVNARFIVGLLPAAAWPDVLKAYTRVTRPGGIMRLTETDLPISGGAALEALHALISRAYASTKRSFSPEGRLLSVTPVLKRLLQDAGCQDVQQEVFTTNVSAGNAAHSEVCQDIASTYQLVLPLLVAAQVATLQEVEQLYQRALSEMQADDFCANVFYLTVWGKKAE
jgi:ubiquinone/menaquinone biosynthesis C-methylase UbiE